MLHIKLRIERVEVTGVEVLLGDAEGFAKPLEVYDLPRAQEPDGIADIRIFDEPQDIVVCCSGFLLCYTLINATQLKFPMNHYRRQIIPVYLFFTTPYLNVVNQGIHNIPIQSRDIFILLENLLF